jgi:hypothetical protein
MAFSGFDLWILENYPNEKIDKWAIALLIFGILGMLFLPHLVTQA